MKDETVVLNKFKLDRFSPLSEDCLLLNIDLKKFRDQKGMLNQATILGLFENKKELIIVYHLPVKGQYLSELVVNQQRYHVQLQEEDGLVHKYAILRPFKPGKLKITEYAFLDDSMKRSTFAVNEEHVFGVLNHQYFYDSKKYYQTQLIGELFHDVIDMTTTKDRFQDFLGRSIFYQDISSLKAKAIKLYYVAFNLYDQEQGRYFFPENIVEMKLQYKESRYIYQAKKVSAYKDIDPLTVGNTFNEERHETVQKETRKLESGERSEWNILANFFTYKQYKYDSIFQVNNSLKQRGLKNPDYTYVLVVGPKYGYRLSREVFQRNQVRSYDFEETKLSHIRIHQLTYQQKGHRYAVPVQSLVYESDKKSRLPRFKNRVKRFFSQLLNVVKAPFKFVFGAGGILLKVIQWIVKHWRLVFILIIGVLFLYLGLQIARFFSWI
jgi:hypothetical protein